jgi:hypothetical protein
MRTNTQTAENKTSRTARKTWQWNSALIEAEQAREQQVRNAQRRFRSSI